MKLYRFSPIENKQKLLDAIGYLHLECNRLCDNKLGMCLENACNVGIFCHYDDEYENLKIIQREMCTLESHRNKYMTLKEPLVFEEEDGVPKTEYKYLYIRKPDPYRHHVGDVDFNMSKENYNDFIEGYESGDIVKPGVRLFSGDFSMVELHDADSDVLSYVGTSESSEVARNNFSNVT